MAPKRPRAPWDRLTPGVGPAAWITFIGWHEPRVHNRPTRRRSPPRGPPLEEQGYDLDPEATESRQALPSSLSEAVTALANDEVIGDALGGELVGRIAEAKRLEWQEFATHVTDWEMARYL